SNSGAQEMRGHEGGVWTVAVSADGQLLFSGGADRNLIVWKIDGRSARQLYKVPFRSRITAIASRQSDNLVSIGGDDGVLHVYAASSEHAVKQFEIKQRAAIKSAAFSPDGASLAVGTASGRLEIYRLNRTTDGFAVRTPLLGHSGPVNSVAFSADGSKLTSGSSDKSIRLWDLANPDRDPILLQDHQWWVWSVAMHPRGGMLVSGSADKTLRFWNISSRDLADRVCSAVERNLSQSEWSNFIGGDVDYVKTCPNLPLGKGIQPPTSNVSR
ncbi:WD40 repeat domain-containing protein, partial [bacterium]|nr:WD40 repeat domain-containing protein [bacterium]